MSKAFKTLLNSLNAQIAEFNKEGLKIYDQDNPEYFITGIVYSEDEDKLNFKTEEDPEERKRLLKNEE